MTVGGDPSAVLESSAAAGRGAIHRGGVSTIAAPPQHVPQLWWWDAASRAQWSCAAAAPAVLSAVGRE
jgi:hypothetical protein